MSFSGGSTEGAGRIPPQALEAERAVLGAMMLEKDAIGQAIEVLTEECFYRQAHRRIYQVVTSLYDRGEEVDLVTVDAELRKHGWLDDVGGMSYLTTVLDSVVTAANIVYHAQIVLEKSTLRRLIDTATRIVTDGYEQREDSNAILDQAERSIFAIQEQRLRRSFSSLRELIKPTFTGIEEQFSRKSHVTGVETGFTELDVQTAGFQPSDLIIIAGRPSMGKTSFCINIAEHAGMARRVPTAIFSLEMSKEQLVRRMLCSQSGVSGERLRSGFLRDSDWPALAAAASRLSEAPIYIDDSASLTVLEMRAKARRLSKDVNLGMIIIDYLQLARVSGPIENRQQEISQISRSLKALAKELNVPVVALSQLSRAVESRGGDRRPMLSDLRDSGAIEQDADVVMFVYRPAMYDKTDDNANMAEIIVAKQRNGPTGTVNLVFQKELTRFRNMDSGHRGQEAFGAPDVYAGGGFQGGPEGFPEEGI